MCATCLLYEVDSQPLVEKEWLMCILQTATPVEGQGWCGNHRWRVCWYILSLSPGQERSEGCCSPGENRTHSWLYMARCMSLSIYNQPLHSGNSAACASHSWTCHLGGEREGGSSGSSGGAELGREKCNRLHKRGLMSLAALYPFSILSPWDQRSVEAACGISARVQSWEEGNVIICISNSPCRYQLDCCAAQAVICCWDLQQAWRLFLL